MPRVSVQCRLMPDLVLQDQSYTPGFFYTIAVNAIGDGGMASQSQVSVKASENVEIYSGEEVHKIGTSWSAPFSTNLLGSVMLSIDAVKHPIPPTIYLRCESPVKGDNPNEFMEEVEQIMLEPLINLFWMLGELGKKTEDEWNTFLALGQVNAAFVPFLASALNASVKQIYWNLKACVDEDRFKDLVNEGYNIYSGVQLAPPPSNAPYQPLFNKIESPVFSPVMLVNDMKAAAQDLDGPASAFGKLMPYFVENAEDAFALLNATLNFVGLEIRDIFKWLGLEFWWDGIEDGKQLLKNVVTGMLDGATALGAELEGKFEQITATIAQAWDKNASNAIGYLPHMVKPGQAAMDYLKENPPVVPNVPIIKPALFEMNWVAGRLIDALPSNSKDIMAIVTDVIKEMDLDVLMQEVQKVLDFIKEETPLGALEQEVEGLKTLFESLLGSNSSGEVVDKLMASPQLGHLVGAPSKFLELCTHVEAKKGVLSTIFNELIKIFKAILNTPIHLPFLDAFNEFVDAGKSITAGEANTSGIKSVGAMASGAEVSESLLDIICLTVAVPVTTVFATATSQSVPVKEGTEMAGAAIKAYVQHAVQVILLDPAKMVMNTPANLTDMTSATDVKNPELLVWPCDQISDKLPHHEQVLDSISLFLSISEEVVKYFETLFTSAISSIEAVEGSAKSEAEAVAWYPVILEGMKLSFGSTAWLIDLCQTGTEQLKICLDKDRPPFIKLVRYGVSPPAPVFHPLVYKWIKVLFEPYPLSYEWVIWVFKVIDAASEDAELGAGAADLEISGAVYTEAASAGDDALDEAESIGKTIFGIEKEIISVVATINEKLYCEEKIPRFGDDVERFFKKQKPENDTPCKDCPEDSVVISVLSSAMEFGGGVASAGALLTKIPEAGPYVKAGLEMAGYEVYNLAFLGYNVVLTIEYIEKYHPQDQAKYVFEQISKGLKK